MGSVSSTDVKNSISTPKQDGVDRVAKIVFIDESGNECKQEKDSCGRVVIDDDVRRYFVKERRGGKFYNPLDRNRYRLNDSEKSTGDPLFKYREVTQRVFNTYLRFLQTGQELILFSAERENA